MRFLLNAAGFGLFYYLMTNLARPLDTGRGGVIVGGMKTLALALLLALAACGTDICPPDPCTLPRPEQPWHCKTTPGNPCADSYCGGPCVVGHRPSNSEPIYGICYPDGACGGIEYADWAVKTCPDEKVCAP